MISVHEAERILSANSGYWGVADVAIDQASGRMLAEDLVADRDFPPFDRVTMDGIGINHRVFARDKEFSVQGIAAAGMVRQVLVDQASCLEVMTGAITPEGVSAIIRYEDVELEQGRARINLPEVKEGMNIHRQGTDRKLGDLIVSKGRRIGSAEVGIAATVGKETLKVLEMPRIVVVSTGDELVPIGARPLPHQIRTSNAIMIQESLKRQIGVDADLLHLRDDQEKTKAALLDSLQKYEVLIFLGGSSKGKFDFIPSTLEGEGVKRHFYKVAQRPGKPFWFGTGKGNRFVFALPGNPVSCLLCLIRYVVPWLKQSLGHVEPPSMRQLSKRVDFDPTLTYFAQAQATNNNATMVATPVEGRGSGDLANLCDADGFIQLPADRNTFNEGEYFPFYSYR